MQFHIHNLSTQYDIICQAVRDRGSEVSPRGHKTREVLGATIIVEDPTRNLPVGIGRGLKPAIGAVEAAQLIAGVSMPDVATSVAPNLRQFAEDDGSFHGAYGLRAGWQMASIIERLAADRDTRQAVLVIWSPYLDTGTIHKDMPCTVSLHFMIRNGKLNLHVTMRSNDVWWGLAYDVFQFTQLQMTVARCLGIGWGRYFHHANSLHIYERDWDKVDALHEPTIEQQRLFGFGDADIEGSGKWGLFAERAYYVLTPHLVGEHETFTEQWYRQQLADHV